MAVTVAILCTLLTLLSNASRFPTLRTNYGNDNICLIVFEQNREEVPEI